MVPREALDHQSIEVWRTLPLSRCCRNMAIYTHLPIADERSDTNRIEGSRNLSAMACLQQLANIARKSDWDDHLVRV